MWRTKRGKTTMLVLYFETYRKKDPIWLAYEPAVPGAKGSKGIPERFTSNANELPRGAFDAMWNATQ